MKARCGMLTYLKAPTPGLVAAEVELEYEEQKIVMPPWAGEEVTGDHRFGNSHLARYPFVTWSAMERIVQHGVFNPVNRSP